MNPTSALREKIAELKQKHNAIILAHFYQTPDIQDIADHIGDSLALAQLAAKTTADIIVLAGVYFMAETAKLLNTNKIVLAPDPNAGCSLADSCSPAALKQMIDEHKPDYVVTYVNTTAEIKALSDITVTSSNALQIIQSLPQESKILFAPDRNLGAYIQSLTKRQMILFDGACHVHEKFSLDKILLLQERFPKAKLLVHPECPAPIRLVADFIGSTAGILNFAQKDCAAQYIIATEPGILHQMQRTLPQKEFIPAPPNDSTCACNDCQFMKMITLDKIYTSLQTLEPQVIIPENIQEKALRPISEMLRISAELKLI